MCCGFLRQNSIEGVALKFHYTWMAILMISPIGHQMESLPKCLNISLLYTETRVRISHRNCLYIIEFDDPTQ